MLWSDLSCHMFTLVKRATDKAAALNTTIVSHSNQKYISKDLSKLKDMGRLLQHNLDIVAHNCMVKANTNYTEGYEQRTLEQQAKASHLAAYSSIAIKDSGFNFLKQSYRNFSYIRKIAVILTV